MHVFAYDMSYHKEYYLISLLLLFANFSMYINVNMGQIRLCLILKAEVQQYKNSK